MATWDDTPEVQQVTTDTGSMNITQVSSPANNGAYQVITQSSNPVTTYTDQPAGLNSAGIDPNLNYAGIDVVTATKIWQQGIGVTQDGAFGPQTDAATKLWQMSHGVTPDGIVGPVSWSTVLGSLSNYPPTLQMNVGATPPPAQTQGIDLGQPNPIAKPKVMSLAGWPVWAGLGLIGAAIYQYMNTRDSHMLRAKKY
jgi:peptidoglycan hydrolase-like protein with peptidoglycan-binding domain